MNSDITFAYIVCGDYCRYLQLATCSPLMYVSCTHDKTYFDYYMITHDTQVDYDLHIDHRWNLYSCAFIVTFMNTDGKLCRKYDMPAIVTHKYICDNSAPIVTLTSLQLLPLPPLPITIRRNYCLDDDCMIWLTNGCLDRRNCEPTVIMGYGLIQPEITNLVRWTRHKALRGSLALEHVCACSYVPYTLRWYMMGHDYYARRSNDNNNNGCDTKLPNAIYCGPWSLQGDETVIILNYSNGDQSSYIFDRGQIFYQGEEISERDMAELTRTNVFENLRTYTPNLYNKLSNIVGYPL
jgi:hypothetical protein